jgi:ABC-type nitrate/sulfonate/bicarbonate transport system ATPase subunit
MVVNGRCKLALRLPGSALPHGRPGIFPGRARTLKSSELVGRARELAVVQAFIYELSAQSAILRLVGEPGVGKSALLDAAEDIAAIAGIRVLRAGAPKSTKGRMR